MRGREHPTYLAVLVASLLVYFAGRGDWVLPSVLFIALAGGYVIPSPGWWRGVWVVGGGSVLAAVPAYLYQQEFLDSGISLYIFGSELLATVSVLAGLVIVLVWYMQPHKLRGPAVLFMSFVLVVFSGNRQDRSLYLPFVGLYFFCLVIHFFLEKRRDQETSKSFSTGDAMIEFLGYCLFIIVSTGSTLLLIGGVTKSEAPMMFLAAEAVRLYEGGSSMRFQGLVRLGSLSGMENSEEPVLSLEGSGPLANYLRCQVFNSYKKGIWKEGENTAVVLEPSPGPDNEKLLVIDGGIEPKWNYQVSLVIEMGSVLPSPEGVLRVDSTFPVLYDRATSLISVPSDANPRQYTLGGDIKHLPAGPDESMEEALLMPEDLKAALAPKARELTAGLLSDSEKAKAISRYFSTYEYSLEPRSSKVRSRKDLVEDFIFDQNKGYCRDFASATVMLLRSIGVPARMVTGFIIRETAKEDKDVWIVRRRDSHAWSEYFDSGKKRWTSFDPTPISAMNDTLDIKSPTFASHVLDRVRILARLLADTIRQIKLRDIVQYITPANVAGFIGVMAMLILASVLFNKRGSFKRKVKTVVPSLGGKKADFKAPGRVTESYADFLSLVKEFGVMVKENETASEILARIKTARHRAGLYRSCSEFINLYNSLRFKRTSGSEMEAALVRLGQIIDELKSGGQANGAPG